MGEMVGRPFGKDDVVAWQRLCAAAERVDRTGENYSVEDLVEELSDPDFDVARDTWSFWSGDTMLAYGKVFGSATVRDVDRVQVEAMVDPEYRRQGLGTRMLDWLLARAAEWHAERHPDFPGLASVRAYGPNAGQRALLEGAGFAPTRHWFGMERPLTEEISPAPVPEGLRLVPFDMAYSEATREAHNEAWVDHYGFAGSDQQSWATWKVGQRAFRPALSYLLLSDDDTVAAYLLSHEYDADTAATGKRSAYVGPVGTRLEWRGRGAMSALFAHALTAFRADGFAESSLDVDSANPTGALSLYERAGYHATREWISYTRPLS